MEGKKNTISVLMLPWSHKNFHIYICSTPINLSSIKTNVTKTYSQSIELVELPLPYLPNLPPHYHTTNGLSPHLINALKAPNFSKILKNRNPDLVIYDFNQPWAAESAFSMNIPAVQFLTVSAAVVALALHMFDKPREKFLFPEIYLREYEILQMKKAMEESKDEKDPFCKALGKSRDIILVKTCRDFVGKYMDYLSKVISKKIVPVGSLVQDSIDQGEHEEVIMQMQSLDKKEKSSTIFVSLWIEFFLSREEIHEEAQGLELSKVNFIWVIRFPLGEKIIIQDVLPKGFLERVEERGIVLEKWAPQTTILQHTSIGGFVSHCGWSYFMESMKFGVPIIAMPMDIDQPMNARIVEYIGMDEEIAKVIREVVIEESGEGVRKKAKELSEKMNIKGDEEIDGVVEELVAICNNKMISNKI
ncbi:unnamed protein product [Withania somnifera]